MKTTKPKRGRPPTGPNGVRVGDLPNVTVKMVPELHKRLSTQAEQEGRAAWRIVSDALDSYLRRSRAE